jgi:Tol biopolymer transport system component/tRNA A-37 threonylcarbamoyl transferase component Bud32
MAVTPGTKLGVYEIVGVIGAGGMGTVYRARDTRLPRDAAIKVSSEKFTDRFAREAHAIASLNHPNITTLYDVGPDYLVMEMVEGPTLADRIRQGPLSLEDAAHIGKQIADGLDYAHERGIVHRDLKPGNVKIRPDGVVKVLDFGLAKEGTARNAPHSDESRTMTAHKTDAGVIVGTAAYMAPEQLKGADVDKRVDIWSFGCVFYEMLTGASAYRGDTSQETMASILRDEPDLTKVPAQARRVLKRCLEKDPQKRLRHIGDVMALLDEPPSGEHATPAASLSASGSPRATWLWAAVAAVAIGAAGAAAIVWAPWRSQASVGQAVRFEVAETDKLRFFNGAAMAVSPDGRWMAFPAVGDDGVARYWLRSLDTVEARALPGTETAFVPPWWTADSRYVIFSRANTLNKVDIQGGLPQALSSLQGSVNGATTNGQGTMLFATSLAGPILRVSAGGEPPIPATEIAKGETAHRFPQFLPDGRHFLYFRASSDANQAGVYVGLVDAKPEAQSLKRILATNRQAYYVRSAGGGSGRLIFLRESTLFAQPFDPTRMELSGEALQVADGVDSFPGVSYGMFSVSDVDSGALAYRGGAGAKLAPVWFDMTGKPSESFEVCECANPAVSPDGTRIAVAIGPATSRDIWTIDVARKTTTRLTFDPGNDDNPLWAPDGKSIAFASDRSGQPMLYVKPADGSRDERQLTDQPGVPTSWSRDGRFLLFTSGSSTTGGRIWVLPNPAQAARDAKPYPMIATRVPESGARFSPDGHWIAYQTSNESGVAEIYVRPFSVDTNTTPGGAKWLVSNGIAVSPRWASSGKQLLYFSVGSADIMAVDIDTSGGFRAGTPRRLFGAHPTRGWDLAPDGKGFLFVTTPNGGRTAPFTVILNWAAALKK